MPNDVWVFNGAGRSIASAVFSSQETAEAWIATHQLSGLLTAYELDVSAYEWAVREGFVAADRPVTSEHVGSFSSAHQPHHHYEDGRRVA